MQKFHFNFIKLTFILLWLPSLLISENSELISDCLLNGINVDLREPIYENGVLKTDKGGVIVGSGIRIQAKKIEYTKKKRGDETIITIVAEEDLIVEFNDYIFVGKRLEYNFSTRSGILYEGRTSLEPWFFGGELVYLRPNGSYAIHNAFVTTSENYNAEWGIFAEDAVVTKHHLLSSRNVQFRAFRIPLLWLPKFKANLNSIFDQPIRYEARAGSQGPRISIAYEIFSWNNLKTFARVDYRLKRGWGGGIENYYESDDKLESFESVNFIARDAESTGDHDVRIRYRFQGAYSKEIPDKKITINLTYDKLSDKEMATDYKERGLDYEVAGRTQLVARKETDLWITNFLTRARVNSFQTIKQELPTFETNIIPVLIGQTGIISENQIKVSYLDFRYADDIKNSHNYRSTRIGANHRFYKPFQAGPVTITPEIGGLLIFEGNGPNRHPSIVGLGIFTCKAETRLHKFYSGFKHVINPYAKYEYYTFPTSKPKDHYIFDIEDGWYRLNMLRFGTCQNFYYKDSNGLVNRFFEADVWSNAFINSDTIPAFIPKIYSKFAWNSFNTVRHICRTAWDFEENQLDHFNLRTEWTISTNLAIAAEYRHRSAYDFRKADPYNFFIDAYKTVSKLRASQQSDRRDTLLFHCFYRLHPNWSVEFESRHGWNREYEPAYNEFDIDLRGCLWSAWNFKLSYQHLEDDDRFTFAISLGLSPPDKDYYDSYIPKLQF
jgi:hypothetical protein